MNNNNQNNANLLNVQVVNQNNINNNQQILRLIEEANLDLDLLFIFAASNLMKNIFLKLKILF